MENREVGLSLPPGPGLAVRWLVAIPLMVLTTVLPAFGVLTLTAWSSVDFHESLPDLGDGPDPTFWSEFSHDLGTFASILVVPGIGLLVFLLRRGMFAAWPKTCLWLGVWVLGPMTLLDWAVDSGDAALPNLALGIGLVWLTYELGRLTLWVLSRPVTKDLVRSELEIPYDIPGSRARLRIRRDQVRLDKLRSAKGKVHKVIRFPELAEVRLDELAEPMSWQADGTRVEVPAGPVLRISGGNEKWVLPVTEAMGEDLAAAITLRAHNKT
jgi:hypothetical protein